MIRKTIPTSTIGPIEISSFSAKIRTYPLLTAEEEADCITRWQQNGEQQALRSLVTSHLRLVAKSAQGYRRYGLPIEDLISEGCVGMIEAIDRFDLDKGFRLATYAKWWIRAAMQEYIMRSWSMVRIGTTVGQKKLFFNLRRLKMDLCDSANGYLTDDDVAEISDRLKVSAHEVLSMDGRMASTDLSLNESVNQEDAYEWRDRLVDERDDQETLYSDAEEMAYRRRILDDLLAELPAREREIFVKRRITEDKSTLGELGAIFEISPERVRQIEHGVYMKIQDSLRQTVQEGQHA